MLECGGGGIRTPGTLTSTTVFKTVPINRSGTPPKVAQRYKTRIGFLVPSGTLILWKRHFHPYGHVAVGIDLLEKSLQVFNQLR